MDFNGVILLSQILNFDFSADGPEFNPGVDLPYQLALPTYAATAWYHHKLPGIRPELQALLAEVRAFRDGRLRAGAGGGSGARHQSSATPSPPSCISIPASGRIS